MEASNAPRSSNGPSNMYVHKLSCSRPAVASNNGSPWRSGFSGSRQTSRPSSTTRSGRDAGRASILGPSRGRGDPEPPSAIIEQPFDDDDDDRMRAVEPRAHVGDRSWIGFERRDAIVDTLVVDVADYRRIGGCRRPDAHQRNATTACAAGPDAGDCPAHVKGWTGTGNIV